MMRLAIIIVGSIPISSTVLSMDSAIHPLSGWQYYTENICQRGKTLCVYSNKPFPKKKIQEKVSAFISKQSSSKKPSFLAKPLYVAIYPKKDTAPFLKLFTVGLIGIGAYTQNLAPASILAVSVNALYEYLEAPGYARIILNKIKTPFST